MARPLRIELAGGLYHVTSRGDRCEAIYLNDATMPTVVRGSKHLIRFAAASTGCVTRGVR